MLFTLHIIVPSLKAETHIQVEVGTSFSHIEQSLENMFSLAGWRTTIIYISVRDNIEAEKKIICGRSRLERTFTINHIRLIYNDKLKELKGREDTYNKITEVLSKMLKEMEENTK